jgi:hypothetical protein
MSEKHIYKVVFYNQGEIYEIFARRITQGGLFGFVEIEELAFGSENRVVIDPSQERLKREFAGVKRTYLPLHSIARIDEVEKEGTGRITAVKDADGKVRPFPTILPSRSEPPSKP